MYWKIVFYHDPSGETTVVVGPFASKKEQESFRSYWEKELLTPKQSRGYYGRVEFKNITESETSLAPKEFKGIPEFFRFTIKKG